MGRGDTLGHAALRRVGLQANRRLLDVERLSHDCATGEAAFAALTRPVVVERQRAAGLRLDDPRVHVLLAALIIFRLLPHGFSHATLRTQVALLAGEPRTAITSGRMTYDLRRLRLHGLILRIPRAHRYQLTDAGLRTALFVTRTYTRILRPSLALVTPDDVPGDAAVRRAFQQVERAMDAWCAAAGIAA